MTGYAELHCHSNFTFLDGAASPRELARQAARLGYAGLALTDRDGLYGIVRFLAACEEFSLHGIVGAEVTVADRHLTLLVENATGYRNLSRLLTTGKQRSLSLGDLAPRAKGLVVLTGCMEKGWLASACRKRTRGFPEGLPEGAPPAGARGELPPALLDRRLGQLLEVFDRDQLFVEISRHRLSVEEEVVKKLAAAAKRRRLPVVATNDVRYLVPSDRELHDVLSCIRLHTTLADAGLRLRPNAEFYLRSPRETARLFRDRPDALATSVAIASRCRFRLLEISHRLPSFPVPMGETVTSFLRALVFRGGRKRFGRISAEAEAKIRHELGIIARLALEGYFLIVADIVRFCRQEGIFCQGRGSAANSIVCYCLGITNVDPVSPVGRGLLFERFLSESRGEPPDIDIDIEHERREEVIQYVYRRYGRDHAAMVCEVISYKTRSAVRDVGKVLGLAPAQLDRLASDPSPLAASDSPMMKRLGGLVERIHGFPRHLSIHVGGMVVTADPICEASPVQPAAMEGRTILSWDKDDCATVGFVKMDLLGLGMLTVLRKGVALVKQQHGRTIDIGRLPLDDRNVYAMLERADTIGVFQVESRAQMNCLPRLKPRCFYDLVVEVALIRPGPIQGEMVHPYLKRRAGEEVVTYPHPSLEPILKRTLGVPLFQEQGMRLAIVAAGFSPEEADELRRAMGHKRSREKMAAIEDRFLAGAAKNGIAKERAARIWKQLSAFADYGFPESHAASFALLVYASAYLKRYYPAEFACALLNAQPMGFYSKATIVGDAKRHGVTVLPPDCRYSGYDCRMERGMLRLGLRYVRGCGEKFRENFERLPPCRDLESFVRRSRIPAAILLRLAASGALAGFEPSRRRAIFAVLRLVSRRDLGYPPLSRSIEEPEWEPASMEAADRLAADYYATGFSVAHHPLGLLREDLRKRHVMTAAEVQTRRHGARVQAAGLVICRQRPRTAKGFCFLTIEDETGLLNVVIRPAFFEQNQQTVRTSPIVMVEGRLEHVKGVRNIQCHKLERLDTAFGAFTFRSRDFH